MDPQYLSGRDRHETNMRIEHVMMRGQNFLADHVCRGYDSPHLCSRSMAVNSSRTHAIQRAGVCGT